TGAVMLKARAGGGGRGTRVLRRGDEVAAAMNRARSEAEKAFGDGTLFAEAYLDRARHIEVQVLGDADGTVVVLGDRDCSLQRHRQKLVEIAPAAGGTNTPVATAGGAGIRIDTAARAGVVQSLRYDPLLAKVVVHERHGDLADALRSTGRALAEFDVRGVATNPAFLRALLEDPEVLAGRGTTTLVDEQTAELVAAAE